MRVRQLKWIGVLVLVSMLAAACGATSTPAPTSPPVTAPTTAAATAAPTTSAIKPGGEVIYAAFQSPDTLDPNATGLISSMKVCHAIFQPLVWFQDGKFYPGLATSWEISSDAKQYTFHLRKGVIFQDGTPFDATAVTAMIDHVNNPETKALGAISALGPFDHYNVVDPYTVQIFFKTPNAAFMLNLEGNLDIQSPAALKKYGNVDVGQHPVGTGPFKFVEWVQNDHVTVERWDQFNWAPEFASHNGPAYIQRWTYKVVPEPATRVATLQTGEVNLIEDFKPADLASFKASPDKYTVMLPNSLGMPYAVWLNVTKAPTDDINVRKAILYAANQKQIIETLFPGMYEPAFTPLDPSTLGYDPSLKTMYQFDLAKAKQLLKDDGWVDANSDGILEKGGQPLQIAYIDLAGFGFEEMAVLLQANLKLAGIDMKITAESYPAVQDTYHAGKHNVCPFFFYFADPTALESLYSCAAIDRFNWAHICDPQIDALIQQMYTVADPTARVKVVQDLQKLLMDQAFIIGLYEKRGIFASAANLKGIVYTPQAYPMFYDAYFASK